MKACFTAKGVFRTLLSNRVFISTNVPLDSGIQWARTNNMCNEKTALYRAVLGGGLYWTRTSDPIDVNDVLYQLSQQTIVGFPGVPLAVARHIRAEGGLSFGRRNI